MSRATFLLYCLAGRHRARKLGSHEGTLWVHLVISERQDTIVEVVLTIYPDVLFVALVVQHLCQITREHSPHQGGRTKVASFILCSPRHISHQEVPALGRECSESRFNVYRFSCFCDCMSQAGKGRTRNGTMGINIADRCFADHNSCVRGRGKPSSISY